MRRLVAVAAAAAVAVAFAAGWPTAAQMAGPATAQVDGLDGDPEIKVNYYDVPGRDQRSIRAAIDRMGPIDSADGERVDAITKWAYAWSWRRKTDRLGCSIDSVEVSMRIGVLLPRPSEADRLSARVRKQWEAYIVSLRRHELGHVEIARRGREDIRRALAGASCDEAPALANAANERVGEESARYDRETRHGQIGGASF